jgi:hypothetical protein
VQREPLVAIWVGERGSRRSKTAKGGAGESAKIKNPTLAAKNAAGMGHPADGECIDPSPQRTRLRMTKWHPVGQKCPPHTSFLAGKSARPTRVSWRAGVPAPQERTRRTGMDITWLTDRIAVGGGIWNSENMAKVAAAGITHIIDMQIEFDDTPLASDYGVAVLWNPTDDDFEPKPAALFERGVKFAGGVLDNSGGKLFIHCAAGVHRAPMMALALLGTMGWSVDDGMLLIAARRPTADFPDVYVRSVERFLDGQG